MRSKIKPLYSIILLLILSTSISVFPINIEKSYNDLIQKKIVVKSLERTYNLYIPKSYQRYQKLPLVIVLHGAKSSGERIFSATYFYKFSEEEEFIIAYPDAVGGLWNDGRLDKHSLPFVFNVDDVEFISQMIKNIRQEYFIDKARVYVAGFSNGAMMAHRMACMKSEKIAAIAVVAGSLPKYLSFTNPQKKVPVMIINGTDDRVVPWVGGKIIRASKNRGEVLSVTDTTLFWIIKNGCQFKPEVEIIGNADQSDKKAVLRITYRNDSSGSEVVLIPIVGGGHTWPGAEINGPQGGVIKIFEEIDATALIWNFFKKFHR